MNKKSQISIFILLAIIILFLFVFLINTSFDEKSQDLEVDKVKTTAEDDIKLMLVKSKVDYCFEKNLNRALIISGLRGGFIYPREESYFPGTIPDGTYKQKFISNMDLNWNNIGSKVLIHAQEDVYTPGIEDGATSGYNRSIRDDIIDFVSIEFMNCLEFDDADESYEITYSDYLGNIKDIYWSTNTILVERLNAEVEDNIRIIFDQEELIGKVVSEKDNGYIVDFDSLLPLNVLSADNLKNLSVINLDKKIKLNLTFNTESIRAYIDYPVTIRKDDYVSTYEGSEVVADIRYEKLLDLSRDLLLYKTYHDRDVDYLDNESVYKALEKSNSPYFKKRGLDDIEIKIKVINESLEHKKYVYTIIDHESLILGNSYVFNFGYENVAPVINFSSAWVNSDVDEFSNVISIVVGKNSEFTYDFDEDTDEYQYWDYYIKYFVEQDYSGPDAEFSLDREGNLKFTAKREKTYNYPIRVTDGEAYREYTLMFITGFPDNTNNQEAINCLRYKNYGHSYFLPISDAFSDKIWHDFSSGKHVLYGYNVYSPLVNIKEAELYFSAGCGGALLANPENYQTDVIFKNKDTGVEFDTQIDILGLGKNGRIEVPQKNFPVEVSIESKMASGGGAITEPYVFTVYPADCLGPDGYDMGGWDLTCCRMNPILSSANSYAPKAFTAGSVAGSNLYQPADNHYAINDDFYFVVDFEKSNFDYLNKNIWSIYGNKISSLFEGKVISKCKGEYSSAEKNIDSINSGGEVNREITYAAYGTKELSHQVPLVNTNMKLKMVDLAEICEFGIVSNTSLRFTLQGGLSMLAGLKKFNTGYSGYAEVSMIPRDEGYNNVAVLCDDTSYAKSGSSWEAITSPVGKNGGPQPVSLTKKYCHMEDTPTPNPKCGFRTDISSVVQTRNDVKSSCLNYYVDTSGDFVSEPATWKCKTDYVNNIQCKNAAGGIVPEKAKGSYDIFCSGLAIGALECNKPEPTCTYSPDCPIDTVKVQSCP